MKIKVVLVVQVIVAGLFGIGFIFLPELMMDPYLPDPQTADHIYLTRLYGSAILGIGALAFFGIWFQEFRAKRGLAFGLGLFTISHCAIFVLGSVQGIITSLGWAMVGLTAVLTLLYTATLLTKEP